MCDIPNNIIGDLLFLCRFCIQSFVYFFFAKKHMSALKAGEKSQVSDLGLVSLTVLLDEQLKCLVLNYLSI